MYTLASGDRVAELFFDCIHYVDDVVTCLLEVGNYIHEIYACLVLVVFFIYALDVGRAELVAQVIDFTFTVVGCDYILFTYMFHIAQQ